MGSAHPTAACITQTGSIPDGSVSLTFTIGGKTTTIGLGPAGLFVVSANTMVRNVADLQPFAEKPADTPASGAIQLRNSSVTVLRPAGSSAKVLAKGDAALTGTAKLRVAVDAPGAPSPCETGMDVGTFGITVENGVVTSTGPGLPLTLSVMPLFLENNLSVCLEMQADFDAQFRIEGLNVVFGPSQTLPDQPLRGTFELRNFGSGPLHILAPGESFGDSNRLGSGTSKNRVLDNLSLLNLVTFRAGRDGVVLDDATCPPVNQSDFFAIVEWDGFNLSCYQPVPAPPAPGEETYVCCVPSLIGYEIYDQSFEEHCASIGKAPYRTVDDCTFFGAVPKTGTCADVVCDEGFRACCFHDLNQCNELQPATCRQYGGVPAGFGVHCDSFPCDEPPDDDDGPTVLADEACCLDDGACQDSDPELCDAVGGLPGGPGSTCADTECLGACCEPDGCCTVITRDECLADGGRYLGFAVDCTDDRCGGGYTCYSIVNFPEPGRYMTIEPACSLDSGKLLADYPGGGSDASEPALFKDDVVPGSSFLTKRQAAAACCALVTNIRTNPAFIPTGNFNGESYGLDPALVEACPPPIEYVLWYTGNVCCWGAPWIYVTTRTEFETPRLQSSFPGGGVNPENLVIRVEIMGGFDSAEEAAAWLCPQLQSRFNHFWCSANYVQWNGGNWRIANVCSLDDLPFAPGEQLPAFDGCAEFVNP